MKFNECNVMNAMECMQFKGYNNLNAMKWMQWNECNEMNAWDAMGWSQMINIIWSMEFYNCNMMHLMCWI